MGGDAKHSKADGHGHGHAHGHEHGHGHGGHDHHDHHDFDPRLRKTVINYPTPEHHGSVAPFEVPDWRIYKVENAPVLVSVKERLAKLGLKDPWLR